MAHLGGYLRQVTKAKEWINSPLRRNSVFLMANSAVTAAVGFFFWMVVARFYSEAEVGLASAALSAASILAVLSRLGLGIALIRFLPKSEKPVEMINTFLTMSGVVAAALAAIFVAGLDLWSPKLGFINDNPIFFLFFISFVVFLALSILTDNLFIARRRAEFTMFKSVISSVFKLCLAAPLALFFHTFGIVSSWGIAVIVAFVISFLLFVPRVEKGYKPVPKLDVDIMKNTWGYSAGNYLAVVFQASVGFVLPLLVVNLLGPRTNAYFYIAWTIAGLLWAIPGAVSTSLFAEGSYFEEGLGLNVRRSLAFIFLLLGPAIIIIFLAGKWLLHFGFGAVYAERGLTLLWMLSLSSIPQGINSVYATILQVERRISELVIIYGFISLAVLLGSYFILPGTRIVGIGYVFLATQGLVSLYAASRMLPRIRSVPRQ
jgi:O-antigen/teichoic acid export membrane protein